MKDRLALAVPSKGRLMEQTFAAFADAGVVIERPVDGRGYRANMPAYDRIEVHLLSASEIAVSLRSGRVDLGVTGDDLVREMAPAGDPRLNRVLSLGFGGADVIVAVPQAWVDVASMADIEEIAADFHRAHGRWLRVATKYPGLTRHFFRAHGVSGYRIVESLGATEGTPATGTAEIIVDITSTGATLAANHLKVLGDGVILKSQAALYATSVAAAPAAAEQQADLIRRLTISRATP